MDAAIGNNIHMYLNLEFLPGDGCDARGYDTITVAQAPTFPGFGVPNPLMVPFGLVIVWGGEGMVVMADDYLLGVHLMLGNSMDVDVNTANPPINLAFGLDSNMRAAAVGQLLEMNVPVVMFGVCVAASRSV